ncbi:MAG: hypothetical protein JWL97_19 [Gemmatimonadales bacterium]|jgi:formate/nitrite transporter FocA (FNT family)|nr:hypothetical protein [Gemmatimonadales bacterium]
MTNFLKPVVVGLSVGLIVCAAGWIVEKHAGQPPTGSDPLMASAVIFEIGAVPLSLLTGGLVAQESQDLPAGTASPLIEVGQVLLNWVLIALVIGWLLESLRRMYRKRPDL